MLRTIKGISYIIPHHFLQMQPVFTNFVLSKQIKDYSILYFMKVASAMCVIKNKVRL